MLWIIRYDLLLLEVKYTKINNPLICLIGIDILDYLMGLAAVKGNADHSALYFRPGKVDRIF